jgi:hypothetical protein
VRNARAGAAALGQGGELRLGRHVGFGAALAGGGIGNHFGQAVIGLRPDHDFHRRRARHDFLALGLGDAAGHRDQRHAAIVTAQAADIGIDLFGGLFADMAGVEHDQIGAIALGRGGHALGGEQFGHALAVIDVHLAAEALDVKRPGDLCGHKPRPIRQSGGIGTALGRGRFDRLSPNGQQGEVCNLRSP